MINFNIELLKQVNVLYVEDEADIRKAISTSMNRFTKCFVEAVDGLDGVEKFRLQYEDDSKDNFDVVVVDINMPGMNGLDMCKQMRKIDPSILIIVATAHLDKEYLYGALKLDVRGYIVKPIQLSQLLEYIVIAVEPKLLQKELNTLNKHLQEKINTTIVELENSKSELEELNQNLTKQVELQVHEICSNMNTMSKYIIYSKTDLKGIITETSDAFCDISQYSRDELVGKSHNITRHPDMPTSLFKDMWNTIESNNVWKGEMKNLKKDGGYYWVMANISPEYDENGNICGYISVRHDITDKKELENLKENLEVEIKKEVEKNDKIQQQLFEYEKLNSMGDMISNIAHQWRQPLSAIATATSAMKVEKELNLLTDNSFEHFADGILDNTNDLTQTIETFAHFLKEKNELKDIIFQECINHTLEIVSTAFENNNITIEKDINYDNPIEVTIVISELYQVIIDILTNAKDILLERKIEFPLIKLNLKENENNLIFSIEDNAGGIPEDIIHKIFDPYFTTKHKSQGTGLALYQSYIMITENLNGKLYVENTDIGAKFFIELPKKDN